MVPSVWILDEYIESLRAPGVFQETPDLPDLPALVDITRCFPGIIFPVQMYIDALQLNVLQASKWK